MRRPFKMEAQLFRRMYCALGALGLLLAIAPATPATAAGQLDTTFSGDGKLIADFGTGRDGAADLAIQPDGRIVAATGSGLLRYTPAGLPDPSFSGDGRVPDTPRPHEQGDNARGVAIQPDGRILAIISTGVARYLPDGGLDPSFSGDGRVDIPAARRLALGADGKIVVAGSADSVARLRSDGSPDTGFAGDGTATLEPRPREITDIAVQADGKIVMAETWFAMGTESFAVERLTANGATDRGFGDSGVVWPDWPSGGDQDPARGVAIQDDGKIVAAGGHQVVLDEEDFWMAFAVARLNRDGSLDRSFSRDGKHLVRFGGDAVANGVALQPDGGIVLAGRTSPLDGPTYDFALARLRRDGSLSGRAVTSLGRGDFAQAVALQPDGRITAAGSTGRHGESSFPGPDNLALARYTRLGIERPSARLVLRRGQRLRPVLRRGLPFRLKTKGLVRGSARLVAGKRTLGRGRPRLYRRGSTRVRVRLSRRAKRRLLRRSGGRLLLRVRVVNAEGTSRLLRARVRVR